MAKRPTLTDLTSLTNSSAINALSENWDAIEEAFDNTLSLDGSTPNAMNADLDLNGNALLNVGTIDVENLTLDGQTVTDLASVPEWRGSWVTATSYTKNDLVKTSGNVYICLVTHTSGTFATDLTALRWELMVSKGDSGAGSGDVVSTNNLSDLADIPTARANLGLGTVAVESTVPIAKGGTGATDAATARSSLGLGDLAVEDAIDTTMISAATLVTESDSISSNDNDTTIPTSAAVKAYVDSLSAGLEHVETIATTSGSTITTTVAWTAGYGYMVVFEEVEHSAGSSRDLRGALYGVTDAAYSGTFRIGASVNTDGWYGAITILDPGLSRKNFFVQGGVDTSGTAATSNSVADISSSNTGGLVHWATAQTVTGARFSLSNSGSFNKGSVIVYRWRL